MSILIFTDENDQTSNDTINWLLHSRQSVVVCNNDNFILDLLEIKNDKIDFVISSDGIKIHYLEISSYWMRRGNIYFNMPLSNSPQQRRYLELESITLADTIMSLFYELKGLGKIKLDETNKNYNLILASRFGLKIPTTFSTSFTRIVRDRLDLKPFCTKAICQGWYRDKETSYNGPTSIAHKSDTLKLNNITWPSLLQEYQEKRYELRIFYLDGDFYTSVIFSQNDEQTKVDFRNYNNARPNRTPPYQLPQEIEDKLHNLMQKLTIKCGSIDMVVNTKNEFVFLEVNPFGQFQQVSFPCNYYLEQKVAEYLTKYD